MPPQPLESRIESVEHRVTKLEELPGRIDDLTLQVSQLRTEMSAEFSAVRAEMRAEFSALRGESAAESSYVRGEFAAVRAEMATGSQMRALYEDVISRIALLQEGLTQAKRKPRRKQQ